MKTKTSNLNGAALDWAVAKCWYGNDYDLSIPLFDDGLIFSPSTNWAHGGPIIEREKIDCIADPNGKDVWMGQLYATRLAGNKVIRSYGPTPLVAAMRCFVASRLGDEVNIPDELIGV